MPDWSDLVSKRGKKAEVLRCARCGLEFTRARGTGKKYCPRPECEEAREKEKREKVRARARERARKKASGKDETKTSEE
jgi:uncharacterized Zn finger protein (UPF0148 family)